MDAGFGLAVLLWSEGNDQFIGGAGPRRNGDVSLSTSYHKYDDILFLDIFTVYGILRSSKWECNMPRKSPYDILLTTKERNALEAIARKYTSPYFEVVRAKIILLAADGLDNRQIGQRLELPRQIVSKWRKRFFESRLVGLHDQSRRGRPRAFSP